MTARAPETELDVSFRTALGIFVALGVVFFFPAFLPGQGIFGTDYLAGSYQFMEFLSNQLRSGEMPKWVPYVYGGVPLHANPGSTYYPTRLALMWLLPDSRVFPALLMSQLIIGGSGMYLLARELGARTWISFLAGLAFMFTGITMSGLYSGHDGRIIVATFAPLAFFFIHRGMRTGSFSSFAGLAATLGFTLLSFQIQSNYYLLLGGAFWTLFCAWQFREAGGLQVARRMMRALLAVAFAFALSAVNFLPFLDYVAESPRGAEGGRGYEYSTSFSMPPAETIGFAIPEQQGVLGTYHGKSLFKQHTEYVGAVVIAMLLLGFVFTRRSRYWIFFAVTALVALSMSYGGYTPIYRIYYALLPGVDKFRAPSISLFMVSMSLVVMAALTLEALARIREQASEASRAVRRTGKTAGKERSDLELAGLSALVLAGLGILLLFVSQVISSEVNESTGWLRFGLFLGITSILIWAWVTGKLPSRVLAMALCVVTLIDMWVVTRQFFQIVPPPEEVYAPDDVVQYLRAERDSSRIWVFPFGGPAVYRGVEQVGDNRIPLRNYLMHFGIEQAGGEHGNQLDRWNKYAGAGEKVYVDWHNFLNSAHFRSAANVRYIISGVDLGIPAGDSAAIHMEEVYRGPSAIIYRNNLVLPRAYLVPRVEVIADTDSALAFMNSPAWNPREVAVIDRPLRVTLPDAPLEQAAVITERKPNRVVVRTNTNRPALLVLSDVYAHGWKAYLDDNATPIVITNVAFRGVPVDAGEHTVRFEFDPDELRTGRMITAVLALLLIGYGIWYVVSARRKPREGEEAA
ncbi:MAG: YfhO family protein [Gemmatimonadaceae bacterium]